MADLAKIETLAKVLREGLANEVASQFSTAELITSQLRKGEARIGGRSDKIIVPIQKGFGPAPQARNEDEAVTIQGSYTLDSAEYTLKYLYTTFQITSQALRLAKSGAAVVDMFKRQVDQMRETAETSLQNMLWADGTGQKAQCGTTSSSATVVIASDTPILSGALYPGMKVDIGTASNVDSVVGDAEIVSVNENTPSITIDSSVTTSSSHYVTIPGNMDDDGTNVREPDGLTKVISTSANTVGGIADSSNPFWAPVRKNASGAGVTEALLNEFLTRIARKKGQTKWFVTSDGQVNAIAALLQGSQRIVNSVDLKGGYKSLAWSHPTQGEIALVGDVASPKTELRSIDERHITLYYPEGDSSDWQWVTENGNHLFLKKGTTDFKDTFWGSLKLSCALGTDRRNVHGTLYGLASPGY